MTNITRREFVAAIEAFCLATGDANEQRTVDPKTVARYIGMQFEELAEKVAAIGFLEMTEWLDGVGETFKSGKYDAFVEYALTDSDRATGMLDADIDLAWVSLAGSFAAGANVRDACHEVATSNISKISPDGKVQRDANGKIMKPPYFVGPNLGSLVNRFAS